MLKSSNRALLTNSLVEWLMHNQKILLEILFEKYASLRCSCGVELFHVNEEDGNRIWECYSTTFKTWN